ncbi:CHAT domain-containing protein [Planctobacterium marinum]|nr:CHAT domain-containing protein [Planctobacterium marinum]
MSKYRFIFHSLLLILTGFAVPNGAANSYYTDFLQNSCEAPTLVKLINSQPVSQLGLLVIDEKQLTKLYEEDCFISPIPLSETLTKFVSEYQITEAFTTWYTLLPKDKEKIIEAFNKFNAMAALTPDERLLFKYWLFSVQNHSFLLNNAIETASSILLYKSIPPKQKIALKLATAEAFMRLDKTQRARTEFDTSSRLIQQTNDVGNSLRIRYHYLMAELLLHQDLVEDAYSNLRSAESITQQPGYIDHRDKITLQDNWGYYYARRAMQGSKIDFPLLHMALDREMQALALAREFQVVHQQIVIHSNIARMHSMLGKLNSAKRNYLIALHLLQSHPDKDLQAFLTSNIAHIYEELGDPQRANYYLTASAESSQHEGSPRAAKLICKQAEIAILLNDIEEAQTLLFNCEAIAQSTENDPDLQLQIANLHAQLSNGTQDTFNKILAIIPEAQDLKTIGQSYLLMAELSQPDKQYFYLQKASEMFNKASNKLLLFEALYKMSALKADNTALAEQTDRIAIGVLSQLGIEETSMYWIQKIHVHFINQVRRLINNGNIERALQKTIQIRQLQSQIRRQQISNKKDNHYRGDNLNIYSDLTANALLYQQTEYDQRELKKAISQDLDWLYQDIEQQDFTLAEIINHKSLETDDTKNLRETSFALKSIRFKKDDEALIAYLFNPTISGVFLKDKNGTQFERFEDAQVIKRLIKNSSIALATRAPEAQSKILETKQALLPNFNNQQNYERIYYLPDSELYLFPESLLFSEEQVILRGLPDAGIPLHSNKANDMTFIGSSFSLSELTGIQFNDSSFNDELPMAKQELSNIRDLTPGYFAAFLDRDATKAQLLSSKNSHVLHLSLHHYFNPDNRSDIGLFLSPVNSDRPFATGFLSLSELNRAHFNNQLVFLNGCETFNGKYYRGAGVLGIAQGFINAGAKTVISTLWKVSDRASMEFTRHFYTNYFDNNDPAIALAYAREKMRETVRFRHPYYWSGYVLNSR